AGAAAVVPRAAAGAAAGAEKEGTVRGAAGRGGRVGRRGRLDAAATPARRGGDAGACPPLPGPPARPPGVWSAAGPRGATPRPLPGPAACLAGGRPGIQLGDPQRILCGLDRKSTRLNSSHV